MDKQIFVSSLLIAISGGSSVIVRSPSHEGSLDYVKVASATDGRCTAVVKREGQLYSVEIFGLEPNERFPVSSSSANETIKYTATSGKDGYYLAIIAPNVKGRSTGIAHFAFKSARCQLKVSFPWRDD